MLHGSIIKLVKSKNKRQFHAEFLIGTSGCSSCKRRPISYECSWNIVCSELVEETDNYVTPHKLLRDERS